MDKPEPKVALRNKREQSRNNFKRAVANGASITRGGCHQPRTNNERAFERGMYIDKRGRLRVRVDNRKADIGCRGATYWPTIPTGYRGVGR